jgi:hypothetical protein
LPPIVQVLLSRLPGLILFSMPSRPAISMAERPVRIGARIGNGPRSASPSDSGISEPDTGRPVPAGVGQQHGSFDPA